MKHLIKVPLVFLLLVAFSSHYVAFANTEPTLAKVVVRKTEPLKNSRVSQPTGSKPTKNLLKKRSRALTSVSGNE